MRGCRHELRDLGDVLSKHWGDADNRSLMGMLDKDGNGRIYPAEFRDFVMKTLLQAL